MIKHLPSLNSSLLDREVSRRDVRAEAEEPLPSNTINVFVVFCCITMFFLQKVLIYTALKGNKRNESPKNLNISIS